MRRRKGSGATYCPPSHETQQDVALLGVSGNAGEGVTRRLPLAATLT
jgi:hypothetical protein